MTTRYIVGVDTGGTFTDVVVISEKGEMWIDKADTTPHDFSVGVMEALAKTAERMGLSVTELLEKTALIKHGTTVATNALINREGSKVGLITTRGFEDTTLIMRAIGRVAGLSEEEIKHQATATKPLPLVPRAQIRGVTERIDFTGKVVVPINIEEARQAVRSLIEEEQVDALGINLLWGFVNPTHENKVKELVWEMYPDSDVFVSCSNDLCPVIREYARSNTVIINSYLGRTMETYIDGLTAKLEANGFKGSLLIMQANGGVVHREAMVPVGTLQSGPCGGIIGSKFMAELLGHRHVICTDVGGTSFDVGMLIDRNWSYLQDPVVERFYITWPMINVQSIGAGGGTIAWVDEATRQLKVGPWSAGAVPGPACYGAGGTEATVTDAALALGLLNENYFLGGRRKLDRSKAEAALREKVARPLGMDVVVAAAGVYEIVTSHMADLIRRLVIPSGKMPEEFVLYSFGGAGPTHAVDYAADIGIKRVYVFPTSAVFSSFGIMSADIVHTHRLSYRYVMPVEPEVLNERLAEIEEKLYHEMEREGMPREQVVFRRTFYMRYGKQLNELDVPVPAKRYSAEDIANIISLFEQRYREVYGEGSAYGEAGMELITASVDAVAFSTKPTLKEAKEAERAAADSAVKGVRSVYFPIEKDFVQTKIYDYESLVPGNFLEGPAIVEAPTTTVTIPSSVVGRVDRFWNLELDLTELTR